MSFTWNGVSCESLGMYVEKYPSRPFPQRKATIYDVPGRSGALVVDEDAYTNVTQPYEVFVKGGTTGLHKRLELIAAWLLTQAGYADLTDTYDATIKRKARVANAIEFLNSLNRFGRATIEFDCWPQRFPITPETLNAAYSTTRGACIYPSNLGYQPAYPLIRLARLPANSVTDVNIGNQHITFTATAEITGIFIDCETHAIYSQNNDILTYMITGEWTEKLGDGADVNAKIMSGTGSSVLYVTTRRFKL